MESTGTSPGLDYGRLTLDRHQCSKRSVRAGFDNALRCVSEARKTMTDYLKLFLIAIAHISFLVGAAGTKLFQVLALPFGLGNVIYFGVSTLAAGIAYGAACEKIPFLAPLTRSTLFAILSSIGSLCTGLFLAFNMFGT